MTFGYVYESALSMYERDRMRWGIADFKGLRAGTLELNRGSLTVLTGVNSSGKSSALQSILLMTQSLYHSGGIVLNGPLVRLGEARDLVRVDAEEDRISISIQVPGITEDDEEDDEAPVEVKAEFSPSIDNTTLYVSRLHLSYAAQPECGTSVLDRNRSRNADLQSAVAVSGGTRNEFLHVKSTFEPDRQPLRTYVRMDGFEPVEVIQFMDDTAVEKKYKKNIEPILDMIYERESIQSADTLRDIDVPLPLAVREFQRLIRSSLNTRRKPQSSKL